VAADGTFRIEIVAAGPAQIDVLTPGGQIAMIGFVDAAGATAEVSAATTARALLYIALGGFALPADLQVAALDFLARTPEAPTVTAAVANAMRSNPAALADGSDALTQALAAAQDAIHARARAQASVTPARALRTSSSGASEFANLLIEPSAAIQSGVELLHNPDGGGMVAQNHFRRPAALLFYQTGFENADGDREELKPPVQTGDVLQVPATGRLAITTAVGDALTGNAPWSPELSGAVTLPLVEGSRTTYYEAVLLGPTLDFVTTPPLMRDHRFFPFSAQWNQIIDEKSLDLFWDAIALPLMESFLFGGASAIQAGKRDAFVQSFRGLSDGRLANLGLALRANGGYATAMRLVLDELRTNNRYRLDFINTVRNAMAASAQQKANFQKIESRLAARASAASILAAVQLALASADVAAVIKDLQSARVAESWEVALTLPTVRLEPATATVSSDQRSVILRASITGNPAGDFEYAWSTTGVNGNIHDDLGKTGPSFVSDQREIQYIATTNPLPRGQLDTVTVEVRVLNDDTGRMESLGRATAVVQGPTIQYQVRIDPATAVIQSGSSMEFRAVVDPPPQGGGLFFRWSTVGLSGTLFGEDSDLVTFTAGSAGNGRIEVQVFELGEVLAGSASATVEVLPRVSEISGSFGIESRDSGPGRTCVEAFMYVPKVEDAREYRLHAHGFNDTAFYGTEIRRTWSGARPGIEDMGDQWRIPLSGVCGPSDSAGTSQASLERRFAGMVVDVTVLHN
jgi:hypothetical protein